MGADSKTKNIVCSKQAEIQNNNHPETKKLVNEDLLNVEDSTFKFNIAKAEELVEECKGLSHDEELKKYRQVGGHVPILPSEIGTDFNYKHKVVWFNAIGFVLLHTVGIIGLLMAVFGYAKILTIIYSLWLIYAAGQGVTMGAHRLWSHRAFKAKKWLRIFLLYMHTLAGQNCLWVWVRDHRQHHKYSDTDADPHNANRGFFFSHVGWLMCRKHPLVFEYGKKIDMSDMSADPWIMFQKKYYKIWYTIFALLLPTSVPIIFWNEDPFVALMVAYFARTILNLNATWLVNSAAHLYGTRPFDNTMLPVESMFVALLAVGEGWHNYHHVFPWDYRASEMGSPLNLTTTFIDWLAKYGVIYDRREATTDMVKNRVLKCGDGSHHKYGNEEARKQVTTWFNILKHPLNPTYTNINQPVPKSLLRNGYALGDEELDIREKSDEILKQENEILLQKRMKGKFDENGNVFDGNNNNNHSDYNGGKLKGKKNSLNATKIN